MIQRCGISRLVVVALGGLLVAGATTPPQTPTQPGASTAPADAQQGHDTAAQDTSATDDTSGNVPVFAITSVEVMRSTHTPDVDIVVARGVTSSDGWSAGTLKPLTRGTPADNVLDLVLMAQEPQDESGPASYAPIQAILPLPAEHPFKAIRVRSATNTIALKTIPGFVEVKPPAEICGPCVGKHFVGKGGAVPSGVAADQVVRQEELPPNARVIRPTDGITDMQPDANRLTILLGEDGRIVDAVWQ